MSQFHLLPRSFNDSVPHFSRSSNTLIGGSLNTLKLLPLAVMFFTTGGCERKASSIIDSVGRPPFLVQVSISPSSINTDLINVAATRNPGDTLPVTVAITARLEPSPGNPISVVNFSLRNPDNTEIITEGKLLSDNSGSSAIENSIFLGKAAFQIQRGTVGVFDIEVSAEAKNGFQSNTIIMPLLIYRGGNQAPVLSDLQAPDTVQLGSQVQLLTLQVRANDPDGLADVSRVVFNSYKPDGSPSVGNPFQMHDDGSNGDSQAGDGVFSLIISLPATTPTGTYRFEFQAFDRSNQGSNIIVHTITVKQ